MITEAAYCLELATGKQEESPLTRLRWKRRKQEEKKKTYLFFSICQNVKLDTIFSKFTFLAICNIAHLVHFWITGITNLKKIL